MSELQPKENNNKDQLNLDEENVENDKIRNLNQISNQDIKADPITVNTSDKPLVENFKNENKIDSNSNSQEDIYSNSNVKINPIENGKDDYDAIDKNNPHKQTSNNKKNSSLNFAIDNKNSLSKSSSELKSNSQSNIRKQSQSTLSPIVPTTKSSNPKKISQSMTSIPSKRKRNSLFERSIRKTTHYEDELDDYQNVTFSYSNPYVGSNKRPVTSSITSQSSVLGEVEKRKKWIEKEKEEEIQQMKNSQFRASNRTKNLAKKAIQKKKEEVIRKSSTNSIHDEGEDLDEENFEDDQILPDDTEKDVHKEWHASKMPAYLSRVSSFSKKFEGITKIEKEEKIRNLKKSKK